MARLDGKIAVITGAGTGIARATARAFMAVFLASDEARMITGHV
jgi:NAD(P)-dependent dehydrogenase (short-subunit alcohol dehydrogenase family)